MFSWTAGGTATRCSECQIIGLLENFAVFSRLLHEGNRWFDRFPVSIVADVNLQNSDGKP